MKPQERIAIIGVAGLLVAGFVYSQIYIHKRNREELEEIARELAYTWKQELDLDHEQTLLMEDVIIAYTIRKNEVLNSGVNEDSLIRRLQAIQRNEHKKLKKFLTEAQFEKYIKVNKNLTRKA
ncbi:hypothetical protein [Salegentibacter sediminis]|uniref:hypothetical protein n=1 Tax=Salegentibacter sediminis TaxID=1930251 RepID=UPI0009BEA926|nr:hypothetical protein [Salegentibacter sediminis]